MQNRLNMKYMENMQNMQKMQIMRTGQSSQHLGLTKNQECLNRRYCKQKKTLKQVLQKKEENRTMRMCHEWETAEAAAGETWFSPHCTTSTYHRIPHQAPCPWKLQLSFAMSVWAGKLSFQTAVSLCVVFCKQLTPFEPPPLVGEIAVAIDCHFLKSNPQTCWIRVSVNFNNSINSEHRADFVHSDFVLAI